MKKDSNRSRRARIRMVDFQNIESDSEARLTAYEKTGNNDPKIGNSFHSRNAINF